MLRWVIDVYHNAPHEGLNGETPAHAWNRLTKVFHKRPPPGAELRRLACGEKHRRRLNTRGITFLGINYQNSALAHLLAHAGPVDLELRVDTSDLGAVSVKIGDSWHTAPAVRAGFNGVSVHQWLASAADLKRRFDMQVPHEVLDAALADIRKAARRAEADVGIDALNANADAVAAAEAEMFARFEMPQALEPMSVHRDLSFGSVIETSGEDVPRVPPAGAKKSGAVAHAGRFEPTPLIIDDEGDNDGYETTDY